jgi:hypothetical protein
MCANSLWAKAILCLIGDQLEDFITYHTSTTLFPTASGHPVDLDGKLRVQDGQIDMGAYEHGHRLYLPLVTKLTSVGFSATTGNK